MVVTSCELFLIFFNPHQNYMWDLRANTETDTSFGELNGKGAWWTLRVMRGVEEGDDQRLLAGEQPWQVDR